MKSLEEIQRNIDSATVLVNSNQKKFDALHQELFVAQKAKNSRKMRSIQDKIELCRLDLERSQTAVSWLSWVIS